ncbi:MAG: methanogenesis marker 9 domain-containing protein, partial [Methanosarcinaceae archaeon]|nr:methanogenesis marker 9 domain-containing protein [Methanosarcinaceae archaeon]
CKASKPCYIRDGTLKQLNLSKPEYSKLKKQMSEKIVDKIFEKGLEAA